MYFDPADQVLVFIFIFPQGQAPEFSDTMVITCDETIKGLYLVMLKN